MLRLKTKKSLLIKVMKEVVFVIAQIFKSEEDTVYIYSPKTILYWGFVIFGIGRTKFLKALEMVYTWKNRRSSDN